LGVIAVIDWIVFPALTAPSTIFNVLGLLALIGIIVFAFHYIKDTWFTKSDEEKRLDADWKFELEKKMKKSNPKQFDGVESDEPFVKTRSKPKTEKVMGEYQLNNKEKVRKSLHKTK
jgi:hypothetical protein